MQTPTRIIMEFAKKANFGVNASLNGLKNALKRLKKLSLFSLGEFDLFHLRSPFLEALVLCAG